MSILSRLRGDEASGAGHEYDGPVYPCLTCGLACPPGSPVVMGKDITPITPAGRRISERTLDLARCPSCTALAEHAEAVVLAHPRLVGARGPAGARAVVAHVVTALDLLAQPMPTESMSDADLGALIHHLAAVGASLPAHLSATPDRRGTDYPFAHVSGEQVDRARTAYGAYLYERAMRSRPPVLLAPPEDSARPGCLMCGVGAVAVPSVHVARVGHEQARHEVWQARATTVTSLGRSSPDTLRGHLCPLCSDAVHAVGSMGPAALIRAYVAALRARGAAKVAAAIEAAALDSPFAAGGLIGWGALPKGTQPFGHDQPFAHVLPPDDLD